MFWKFITSIIRIVNPEIAHNISLIALKIGLHPRLFSLNLPINIKGLDFSNPIGLAAGFDKNAKIISSISHLNFGFTEVGTITPLPQYGNPKPRVFRLIHDQAIINRNGFNNIGLKSVKKNLIKYRKINPIGKLFKVGINIGPNKSSLDRINDYKVLAQELAEFADYISINISSPNTPTLRALHAYGQLKSAIKAAKNGVVTSNIHNQKLPIFLKLSPATTFASI